MKIHLRPYGENTKDENSQPIKDFEFHNDDFWNLDSSLALIIYHSMLKYKQRSSAAVQDEGYVDKYDYVLKTFKLISDFKHIENIADEAQSIFINKGLHLFADLFQTLWD